MTDAFDDLGATRSLDEYERHLVQAITEVQQNAMKAAEPYVRELTKVRNLRPLPPMILPAEQPIDYTSLLRRYIRHVLCQEGTAFVWRSLGPEFTDAEKAVLRTLADKEDAALVAAARR